VLLTIDGDNCDQTRVRIGSEADPHDFATSSVRRAPHNVEGIVSPRILTTRSSLSSASVCMSVYRHERVNHISFLSVSVAVAVLGKENSNN
jgi:hypothetical protein